MSRPAPGDVADAATLSAAIKALRIRAGSHDRLAADINERFGTRLSRGTIISWEKGTFPTRYLNALRQLGVPERLLVDSRATAKANRDRLAALEASAVTMEDLAPWLRVVRLLAEGQAREARRALPDLEDA